MEYRIKDSRIVDEDIAEKIASKVDFERLDKSRQYDVEAEFYNQDLVSYSLNEDITREIKREHIRFLRTVRNTFEENGVHVNKFCLMGTVSNLDRGEINILCKKSKYRDFKENTILPCKEIFMYEDGKVNLDRLLYTNQISLEEYNANLEDLREEFNIYEGEEEFRYLN